MKLIFKDFYNFMYSIYYIFINVMPDCIKNIQFGSEKRNEPIMTIT